MAKIHIPGGQNNLVIFAGAGCSMAPPSSLPGWNDLNDAILHSLWDHLEQYGLKDRFREKILTSIKKKREENSFPPDYQAQRMAERAGIKYFQLLSAVDSNTYNPVQYYTAILANAGIVKAVVTTNFDRNFERAFEESCIPYQSYFDEESFDRLSINGIKSSIPIIKIHGCCSSPGSMIDTRKQRLQGRAKALQSVLLQLLQEHYLIFAGFSGQDLDHNKNYLGLRTAKTLAKGFTYLYLPGLSVGESMNELINFYGNKKAQSVACDPAGYLEKLLKKFTIPFKSFEGVERNNMSIEERLKISITSLQPMDAVNMLTGLAESYGDEISARYLFDKVWRERSRFDYGDEESLSKFLLNHGRSYVFNLQDKKERALSAGIEINLIQSGQGPEGIDEIYTNPAKMNLKHVRNTAPETPALVGLVQTYLANPVLFTDFPKNLEAYFQSEPSVTEKADIIYHFSLYALTYLAAEPEKYMESIQYLNLAIQEMEEDFDEPRLSQLLSRRAMMKLCSIFDNPANEGQYADVLIKLRTEAEVDALRARSLAEKYHEPHLLALSALVLSMLARKKKNVKDAIRFISEAEKKYAELKRIPQWVESIVEYLKIIMMGFSDNSVNKKKLLDIFLDIKMNENSYLIERVNVFEAEYCFLTGMILMNYTNAAKEDYLRWFADSISLAEQYRQEDKLIYFKQMYKEHHVLQEVEQIRGLQKSDY